LHRQIDLGTYLLGGAHVFRPDLYRVTYEPTGLGFTYPPFAALWFAPLAHLPVRLVQVLFTWASLGALLVVLATSLRVTCPSLGRRTVAWWSLLLLAPIGMLDPPRETILLGQINILLVAAVIADMTLVRPGRRGVLVGLAAAIKIIPIVLIPYLLLTRQVGAWRRAAGAFVGAAGLAFATSRHASWAYWSHYLWEPGRTGGLAWIGNQGAVGVIERLVHHPLSSLAMFALVVVISGIGLLIAVKAYRQSWPLLGFLVVEATGAVATPASWSHHFVWVVLMIAWLALAPDRPAHGEWWAIGVAVVFWAAPFWWVPHGSDVTYAGHGWSIPLSDSFFVVLTGILLATSSRLFRRRARRSPPPDTMAPPRFRDGLVPDPELAGELRDASSLTNQSSTRLRNSSGSLPGIPADPSRSGGSTSAIPAPENRGSIIPDALSRGEAICSFDRLVRNDGGLPAGEEPGSGGGDGWEGDQDEQQVGDGSVAEALAYLVVEVRRGGEVGDGGSDPCPKEAEASGGGGGDGPPDPAAGAGSGEDPKVVRGLAPDEPDGHDEDAEGEQHPGHGGPGVELSEGGVVVLGLDHEPERGCALAGTVDLAGGEGPLGLEEPRGGLGVQPVLVDGIRGDDEVRVGGIGR
jgi:alpha-1,2-mannosyltransferase